MNPVSAVRAFARFWYDFIVGDDWKIAAGVAAALGLTIALVEFDVLGAAAICVLGATAVALAFAVSLAIDVRGRSR